MNDATENLSDQQLVDDDGGQPQESCGSVSKGSVSSAANSQSQEIEQDFQNDLGNFTKQDTDNKFVNSMQM